MLPLKNCNCGVIGRYKAKNLQSSLVPFDTVHLITLCDDILKRFSKDWFYQDNTWVSYSHPRSALSPPRPNGGTLTWLRERASLQRTQEAIVTIIRGVMLLLLLLLLLLLSGGRVSDNWGPRNSRSRDITTTGRSLISADFTETGDIDRIRRSERRVMLSFFGAVMIWTSPSWIWLLANAAGLGPGTLDSACWMLKNIVIHCSPNCAKLWIKL